VLVDVIKWLLHNDIEGKMLQKFCCDGRMLKFMTYVLQESLLPHTFIKMQEGNAHGPASEDSRAFCGVNESYKMFAVLLMCSVSVK
jgi:hypothetical protein